MGNSCTQNTGTSDIIPQIGERRHNNTEVLIDASGATQKEMSENSIDEIRKANNTSESNEVTIIAMDREIWSSGHFLVRGPNYMNDKSKRICTTNLFQNLCVLVSKTPDQYLKTGLFLSTEDKITFAIIIHSKELAFTMVFNAHKNQLDDFHRQFFSEGCSDEFRNNHLKLIPKVIDGNIILKMAVKADPILIGKKVNVKYVQSGNYLEARVDVSSNPVATNVFGLALVYASKSVFELGFLLQKEHSEEMMTSFVFNKFDLEKNR